MRLWGRCAVGVVCLGVGVGVCQMADQRAASTREMGSRLRAIYEATDWKGDPNKPAERVEYYRQMLKTQQLKLSETVQVELQLAVEMLQAGDSAGAVEVMDGLRKQVDAAKVRLPAEFDNKVRHTAAIAYLRLGEQENCVGADGKGMAGGRACIFPLRGDGVHRLKRGATGAVREYEAILVKNPEDWEAEWLLNVAYMQLGRYPQDVPKQWLVPESRFRSDADIGEFENVAMQAGVDRMGRSGGVVMEDLDGDGLLDVVITSSGPMDQMRLYHNNGDGTFTDRTAAAGLMGEVGGLNVIAADYDNDGHVDLLVLRGAWWGKFGEYPMSLLRNRGDGTFEDVTVKAGLAPAGAPPSGPTQAAAWADYDGDGRLDLFVGHETEVGADGTVRYPSQMFHNNGDGTFTEVARQLGLRTLGFVKGVAWGDFNNDGRPDLYVSVKGGRNKLLRNDGMGAGGKWRFTDVTADAGVAQQTNSFATWFFDYDNDGWPDIFVAGYSAGSMEDVGAFEVGKPFVAETSRLYRNNHDGTFTDVAAKVGLDRAILTMGSGFGDLDNDGYLDVYLGTGEPSYEALLPNRMFRNAGGAKFEDVTTSGGFGHLQKGHGVAFGDLGNNGHEDVFEEMGGAYPGDTFMPALYKNPGNGNHWVTLELEGVKANRTAVGARVDVTISEGGAVRHVVRWVGWGSSFGYSPLRQHVGLGAGGEVTGVEVRWPGSGRVQRFAGLARDKTYRLREGDAGAVEVVGRKSFEWGGMGAMR